MKLLKTEVKADHLERLLRGRPASALCELVWNALDADATLVEIEFVRDLVDGLKQVVVRDNGTGISPFDAETGFRSLGGSWKRSGGTTRGEGRVLHGKSGQGRFAAFTLGSIVEWKSTSEEAGSKHSVSIDASRDKLGEFRFEVAAEDDRTPSGTTVTISEIAESANELLSPDAASYLTESLAVYLSQYPQARVFIAGERVDPTSLEARREEIELPAIPTDDGPITDARLLVIEWTRATSRSLHFCGPDGISRHSTTVPTIRAPGFDFTAYLRSSVIPDLAEANDLLLGEAHPVAAGLQTAAVEALREYLRRRSAEKAASLVTEWKAAGIYPFQGEPADAVERTERQVFEVVAANVATYLPNFEKADAKSKKFSFSLLREAIANNPDSMQRVLGEVLGLPKAKLDELAELLETTTLSAIISASKLVADRLAFIRALESLVFEAESKKSLLERTQLHRILSDHTWIFGEEFNLTVDDESLSQVLKKHIQLLERTEVNPPERVRGRGGKQQIVDLMLSRRIPRNNAAEVEHLVIELKRPSKKVDQEVFTQIQNYALTVANDERFRGLNTRWTFWALSNELDDFVDAQARMTGRPRGVIGQWEDRGITIWAKTWSEVINEARARLDFFKRKLEYEIDSDAALAVLRRTHGSYFPSSMRSNDPAA